MMEKLPIRLIQLRFALALITPLIALINDGLVARITIVVLIVIGVLSDIFDGVIARKLNVVTDKLRKWDSNVDVLFVLGLLVTSFLINTQMIAYLPEILVILTLELLTFGAYWLKFKKQPSNHSYLTKAFGVILFVNFCMMIGWANFSLLKVLMVVSICSYVDGFAILLRLKEWKVDNKSVFHLNG